VGYPKIPLGLDELLPFFGGTPASAHATFREFCAEVPSVTELVETRPVPGTAN
jgi:hypothetical protein